MSYISFSAGTAAIRAPLSTTTVAAAQAAQQASSPQNVVQYDQNTAHLYLSNASIHPATVYLGAAVYGPPTVYGHYLLVSTMGNLSALVASRYDLTNGSVAAINLTTGRLAWRTYFPNQVMSEPLVVDGLAIVGISNNGEVPSEYYNTHYDGVGALNVTTGRLVWLTKNGGGGGTGPDMPTPAYFNGSVIEPGMGSVDFFDASNGAMTRVVYTGLPDTLSSPLLVNDTAYFGAGYATVYGFNNLHSNLSGAPVNVITNFTFFAVNASTGNILWKVRFPNAGGGLNDVSPALSGNTIVTGFLYQSDYTDPWVVGINRTDGRVLWETNETAYVSAHGSVSANAIDPGINFGYNQNSISPITVYHGIAYLDSNYLGYLVAVNVSSGRILWALNTGQDESNPNAIGNGYLLQINDNGVLFVVNATTGRVANEMATGMPHLSGEPVVTSKYAILAGMDGRIMFVPLSTLLK